MSTISYELYGEKLELSFKITTYADNANLAILVMSKNDNNIIEPYGTMTVNIVKLLKDNVACVDVNNFPEAINIIEQYNLGTFTGLRIPSGYCEYPVYEFNLSELKKYAFSNE